MGTSPKKELAKFLAEDIGKGDITSALLSNKKAHAKIISRESCVVAGTNYTKYIFSMKGCKVRIVKKDGTKARANQTIMEISGSAKTILTCERTALNLLGRMCGIATATNDLVKKIPKRTRIFATRKTAPGLRVFDKEAVVIGGGKKHRMRLDEMVIIKDNHIEVESLVGLIRKAKKKHKKIEVEVESQNHAVIAAKEGATIIMLDNFSPKQIANTVERLKKEKLRKKVKLEASGGINAQNIKAYANSGVDMISVGAITNSAKSTNLSLEI